MRQIFVERITNQTFVEDDEIVTAKLMLLNDKILLEGEIRAEDYFKVFRLKPDKEDLNFAILKGVMFLFAPTKVNGNDAVEIGIEKVDY